ncbi:MAG: DUF3570 domain-containing protein [Opitutaceae bacterium]|nr:DUF3570 domain-containing protein [Opitutaceae bacterium]
MRPALFGEVLSMIFNATGRSQGRVLPILVVLALGCPRPARSENAVRYKFQSWQEDAGRIRVDAHYAMIESDLPEETKLKLVGLVDAIAGATPNGQPVQPGESTVPLTDLTDRRKAWSLDVSRPFGRIRAALTYAQSRESDYVSKAWALNTVTDFNQKNTTLLIGFAQADDEVTARVLGAARPKRSRDVVVGITQLLSPRAMVTVNLTRGDIDGYQSDPYKVIQKNTEVVPGFFLPLTYAENRPDDRRKWILFASANVAFPEMDGALETSYRGFHDDWGTGSHTFAVEWFQSLGRGVTVRPFVRFYRQSAADFYRLSLDGSSIVPGPSAQGHAPYFSADYRLSRMDTWTTGLKVVWTFIPGALSVDAAYERYSMKGRDGVTSDSAYADADVFTAGLQFTW